MFTKENASINSSKKTNKMITIHISEISEGDKILFDLKSCNQYGMLILEVNEVDYDENCVRCKDNYLDFYPDDNGMFIQPD